MVFRLVSMTVLAKSILETFGADPRALYQWVSGQSIKAAVKEQGLVELGGKLKAIVPNLLEQYTQPFDEEEFSRYWEHKMRGLHAFQVQSILDSLDQISQNNLTVVDIGDSSGTHLTYLESLAPPGKVGRTVSINLDPTAVAKIKARGREAFLCRAEDIGASGLEPNLVLVFETLEHLTDPIRFLRTLAVQCGVEYVLATIPYRRISRFGGELLRQSANSPPRKLTPEEVHFFELSPEDWQLLCLIAGYRPVITKLYRQYPERSGWRITAPLWRKLDFEGFASILLKRDLSLADRYDGWYDTPQESPADHSAR